VCSLQEGVPSKVLPELPGAVSGSWHYHTAAPGSTRTRFGTSWSHSSGHFFPTLFFSFAAFFPGYVPYPGDVQACCP
jgi:hypothetical protein